MIYDGEKYREETAEEKKQAEKELRKLRVIFQNRPMRAEEVLEDVAREKVRAGNYDGAEAIKRRNFYPSWDELEGQTVPKGTVFRVGERLFKTLNQTTLLPNWKPVGNGAAVASIFSRVIDPTAGTKENPVLWDNSGELEQGKYYMQYGENDNELYYCFRGTGADVFSPLKEMVGIFVEVENE